MEEVWPLLLLAALSLFTGVASASLAVSSFTTVLPVLVSAFDIPPLQGLFVVFVLDSVNGVFLFFRYKQKLPDDAPRKILYGLVLSTTAAVLSAHFRGIKFIEGNESVIRGGISALLFILGIAFFFKSYRLWLREKMEGPAAIELAVGPGSLEDGKRAGAGAVVRPETSISSETSVYDDTSPVIRWIKYIAIAIFEVGFLVGTGLFAGFFGFGGGNAFAILYIAVYGWETIPATAVSGLLSAVMVFSLVLVYHFEDIIDVDAVTEPLYVALPCDVIALVVMAGFAIHLSERKLSLFVGVLLFLLGIFATVYSNLA